MYWPMTTEQTSSAMKVMCTVEDYSTGNIKSKHFSKEAKLIIIIMDSRLCTLGLSTIETDEGIPLEIRTSVKVKSLQWFIGLCSEVNLASSDLLQQTKGHTWPQGAPDCQIPSFSLCPHLCSLHGKSRQVFCLSASLLHSSTWFSLFVTGLSCNRVATHRANIQPDSCCPSTKTSRTHLSAAGLSYLGGKYRGRECREDRDHCQKTKELKHGFYHSYVCMHKYIV